MRVVLARMEKGGRLTPARLLERLFEIGLSDSPDRVQAIKLALAYSYGRPVAKIDLDVKHGLDESVVSILNRIHDSEDHRRHVEAIGERRRRLNAVTVDVVEGEDAAS